MHLEQLERAVGEWLEAAFYKAASPEEKRAINLSGLIPALKVEMPPAYRLWRLCQDNNTLWWDGGMAAQPRVLMMEFEACRHASNEFASYLDDMKRIIQDAQARQQSMGKAAQGGHPR